MSRLNRWKMADHLNVFQISLLMANYDPGSYESTRFEQWNEEVKTEILPYLTALKNAVIGESIKCVKEYDTWGDEQQINWHASIVDIRSLIEWMNIQGFQDGFFITTDKNETFTIGDKSSEFYAPKLAAAVKAWTVVSTNRSLLRGKSPRKAIEDWLHEHAAEYGLINKDGAANKLGIEEISKVANWKQKGGAPVTPAIESSHHKPAIGRMDWQNTPTRSSEPYPDDEIPF